MTTQVSAYISNETKKSLESYSEMHGVKKGFLIENALNHYLQALEAIPEEFIISTNIVLSEDSFKEVINMIENPPEPTQALIDLMKNND
ncbi:MAG: Unknown protein [uncultured Sulfurovum sp.]|uniref:CopG family transcriptional regulator n=1 Tax=uncultured Sulfurovum sp. TaxID=269237 RepID=A0A6S6SMJ7_9BACT|nr:MAG: Unknown protein [uncultured Sulfurovum sp.]